MLRDYLFEHWPTGDRIFVECYDTNDPEEILLDNGVDPDDYYYMGCYTPKQAEILGYDTL